MKKIPTLRQLEIMQPVWKLRAATVRDVYETLRRRQEIAYTTVMTMMNLLEQKGFLKKRLEGRAYIYEPTCTRGEVIRDVVADLVGKVFDGSAEALLVHLIEDRRLSKADLERITHMIEESE